MKKFIAILLSALMLMFAFAGCSKEEEWNVSVAPKTDIRIAGMKGPTSIGLVSLLNDSANGTASNNYEFTLTGSADEIVPKLIKGELDVAAVPTNVASVLYNKTEGEIQVLTINTLGVLYIVANNNDVASVEDLRGKTILATGKGTTPEYILRRILTDNGIDPDKDVTLDFKSEATEVVSALQNTENAVAMLPEPYVTIACSKVEGLKAVIDLNSAWAKLTGGYRLVTGVLVARKEFVEQNKAAIDSMLSEYGESIQTVNSDPAIAAQFVVRFGIFDDVTVIEKAIPKCNLNYFSGISIKDSISIYLNALYEANPESVGGALPKDDFYYAG